MTACVRLVGFYRRRERAFGLCEVAEDEPADCAHGSTESVPACQPTRRGRFVLPGRVIAILETIALVVCHVPWPPWKRTSVCD